MFIYSYVYIWVLDRFLVKSNISTTIVKLNSQRSKYLRIHMCYRSASKNVGRWTRTKGRGQFNLLLVIIRPHTCQHIFYAYSIESLLHSRDARAEFIFGAKEEQRRWRRHTTPLSIIRLKHMLAVVRTAAPATPLPEWRWTPNTHIIYIDLHSHKHLHMYRPMLAREIYANAPGYVCSVMTYVVYRKNRKVFWEHHCARICSTNFVFRGQRAQSARWIVGTQRSARGISVRVHSFYVPASKNVRV